jgi:glycosyltransferase involved in cell wall biosynthesis
MSIRYSFMTMNLSNSVTNSVTNSVKDPILNPITNPVGSPSQDSVERTAESQLENPASGISISFVINNYNYDRFLTDAITSALNQTNLTQTIEVIVVDDGSTDNSQEILTHFTDHIHPVLKPNGGQASAFNAGFAASLGEWICFLDADDCVRPDKAARILQIIEQYPQAEWIFHPLQPVDERLNPLLATCDQEGVTFLDLRSDLTNGKLNNKALPFPIPATSGLCIRRSLLTQILPMPESEGITLNDTYLQFAALGNRPGVFLNEPLAAQRYHGSNSFITQSRPELNARIMLLTGYWLRQNFPHLAAFSNLLLSQSLVNQWRSRQPLPPSDQALMTTYLDSLSRFDRFYLYLKASYRFLRN